MLYDNQIVSIIRFKLCLNPYSNGICSMIELGNPLGEYVLQS